MEHNSNFFLLFPDVQRTQLFCNKTFFIEGNNGSSYWVIKTYCSWNLEVFLQAGCLVDNFVNEKLFLYNSIWDFFGIVTKAQVQNAFNMLPWSCLQPQIRRHLQQVPSNPSIWLPKYEWKHNNLLYFLFEIKVLRLPI